MANQVTVEKFVDVSRFFLAVSAVEQALTLTENPTPALLKHLKAADPLIKIAAGFLDAGIDSILRETFDKAKIRNKSLLDRALTGGTLSSYGKRASFLQDQLPRLQTHAPAVKDSFGDDFALMRKVIEAAAIENPSARVFALAEFRMADGKLMRLKKWVEKASELFGNPVSDMDTLATDLIAVDSATDALISVQAKAAAKDPTDPESVALKAQAERLKSTIKQVSEQSSDPRTVTARASAKIADNRDGHATAIGRFLEATPQQEDALTTRGHVIMAASAGSGKTRVLAGKVIHHVVDLKTPISSIMAVSFTRKASVELKARILKYAKDSGVNLPAKNDYSAYEGVGTTHKIGRGILTKSGRGYRISTDPKDKKNAVIAGAELSNLIKVAIKQVKMTGSGSAPGPNDMSFFPTVNPKGPPSASSNDQAIENQSPTTNPSGGSATAFDGYLQNPARYAAITAAAADTLREFLKATFKVTTGQGNYGYWVRVAGPALDRFGADIANVPLSGGRISWKPPSDRGPGAFFGNSKSPWDANTVQATLENYFGFPQAKNALALISGLASKDPAALKPEDKQVLQDILSNPTVSEGVRARNVMKAAARKRDDSNLTVSEDGIEVAGEVKESRALDNQTGPYFVYANRPAKQWFNIGASDEDFETIDEKGKVKKLSVSDFTRYIGLHKNNLVAPGAAFVSSSGIEPQGFGEDDADTVQVDGVDPEQAQIFAAVYGAYEWLKRNIPDFQGRVDHDDQLILSSKELIEQPRLLRSYQQQYKCVLVDEAQDLNKAQFVMFGLITGSLDPATLKPRADGKMSADTFALIGDDRQAIYRFRGGVPELFTGKSDLVPGGEGWTTKVLDTNFRSGALIVGTAQKIISYNTNQIPMVCKTDPKKGDGSVYRVPVEDISDAGDYVADQIESARKEAEEDGDTKDFYKKYGIALRTNREVYGYVMKLIEKGIPFRSKKNPLKGPVVKPVVALFNLNSTSVKARNQSVLDGVRCPDFGINSENMSKKLVEAGVTDFYNELVNGDAARFVYSRGSYRARLDQYIAYIQEVAGLLASQSADDVMSFVLSYKSPDGTTFIDSICADAKNDAELMEEVQTIADQENDGDITPEMIRNAALGPINPLRVAAGRFPTATAFNDYIQSLNAANDRTEKKEDDVEADAVQIDTVHGWKGLEVSNLYLAMWQGGFPHARSTRDPELMEEERRVAYVAITRAADNLRIIEPRTVQGKPVAPSQFVTEGCIPLMGDTTKEASLRTASLKLSDYHIPTHYTETEYGEEPTDLDMGPALENAWPDYMVGGEEA